MGIIVCKAQERGYADQGWLKTWRTFSFSDDDHASQAGFKTLRAFNEDRILGGQGLGQYEEHDMEIVTYVQQGVLKHDDSISKTDPSAPLLVKAGEAQHMTAGTGLYHTEANASSIAECHFYQIRILPEKRGLPPRYEQKAFQGYVEQQHKVLIASPDGRAASLKICQQAEIWLQRLKSGEGTTIRLLPRKVLWVQVTTGEALLHDGQKVETGDGIAADEDLSFKAIVDLELLECVL